MIHLVIFYENYFYCGQQENREVLADSFRSSEWMPLLLGEGEG